MKSFASRLAALEALEAEAAVNRTVEYGPDALTAEELAWLYGATDDGDVTMDRGTLMGDVNVYPGSVRPGLGAWLNMTLAKASRALVRYRRVVGAQAVQSLTEWQTWLEAVYAHDKEMHDDV
jgi:hypothetical protein